MALQVQLLQLLLPIPSSSSSIQTLRSSHLSCKFLGGFERLHRQWRWPRQQLVLYVGKDETELLGVSNSNLDQQDDPSPQDLEYIRQIQGVLERLKQNRDMLFSEVKLTVMIEDPREVERRKLLGIDDEDAPSREDLVAALEDVNEGKIPENRVALQMLAEEMLSWPNLEAIVSLDYLSKPIKLLELCPQGVWCNGNEMSITIMTEAKVMDPNCGSYIISQWFLPGYGWGARLTPIELVEPK